MKVFILGRPGSGKSSAARRIAKLAQHKRWSPVLINDYHILYDMFQQEKYHFNSEKKKFLAAEHDGFDVADFTVLDIALQQVEKKARKHLEKYTSDRQKLILIEFARNDYREALRLFNDDFLQDAYFLFIDADIDTCIQRVHDRAIHHTSIDDHFVSDDIIRNYYHKDNKPYIISQLKSDYNLEYKRIKVIDSSGSWDNFLHDIGEFSTILFDQAPSDHRKTDLLIGSSPSIGKATRCPVSLKPIEIR